MAAKVPHGFKIPYFRGEKNAKIFAARTTKQNGGCVSFGAVFGL